MDRWNPWATLRATDVVLWFAPLARERGRWSRYPDHDEILLETTLDRRSRREVLAHELVHVERGIGWPQATAATMELEEERVWRIALERLAPPDQVRSFLRRRATIGPVTEADLAEEFDLSADAAARVAQLYRVRSGSGGALGVVDPDAVEPEGDPCG